MTPEFDDLLEHVVDHLCTEQPQAVADLNDAQIQTRAAQAIRRAQSHGFSEPEPITAFAVLMFLVAPDFDRQKNIAKVLAEPAAPEAQRLQSLFERTAESDWDEAAESSQGWD